MRSWPYPINLLEQIKDALTVLNTFAQSWKEGSVASYTHDELHRFGLKNKVSGESEPVRKNPKLKREREFYLPTGEKVFFENHVKLPQGIRMHFFVQPESHTVFVGYIGSHLAL